MAAKKTTTFSSKGMKQTFGKRKKGAHAKTWNKHTPKPKPYRGQGR